MFAYNERVYQSDSYFKGWKGGVHLWVFAV